MNIKTTLLAVICVVISVSSDFAQEKVEDPVTWDANWSNGFMLNSSDGNFKLKFGGRIMLDFLYISPDSYFDTIITFNKGVEFRRLRFYNSGLIYNNVSYKLQFDFANGHATLKDAFINLSNIPVAGNILIGHFKEPIGLELLNSSNNITFMERALTDPLTPERNTGIMLFNDIKSGRMTWAMGYFLPSNFSGFGLYSGNKFNLSGRITGVPYYDAEDGFKLLHIGLSLTHRDHDNSAYTISSRPETHLAPKLILAEIDVARAVNQYGLEVVYVNGPFSAQGEFLSATALTAAESTLQNDSYNFNAYYGYISWFITGEHRNYKLSSGAFDRVKPKNNFGSESGTGAFEVGIRYSLIDLDDTDVTGGTMSDITLGLNWYLNPATRFMFNYVLTDVRDKGKINGYEFRFQVNF